MPRITGGQFKGLRLVTPRHIRATSDKVRQALFNILGDRVVGAWVLDGFAGSGALGLEALSRQAQGIVLVERHPACVAAVRKNLDRLPPHAAGGSCELVAGDALAVLQRLGRQGRRFDVILLDPPYEGPWGRKALNVVAACGILAPVGILCVEHARQSALPSAVEPLELVKQHRYGDTVLSFYQRP